MSARNVVITGLGAVTQDEVIAAAAVKQGTPLLQVEHRRRRRAGGHDPPGRQRAGAARISVDPSDHRRRAGPRGGQGLSRRSAPVRPRRRGLRDRAAAARACRTSTPTTPGPNDPSTRAALEVMTALRPEVAGQVARVVGAVGRGGHADAGRRPGSGVGDHRPHRGEGAEARGAADPAGPHLRRLQPGSADGQVIRAPRNRPKFLTFPSARLHG